MSGWATKLANSPSTSTPTNGKKKNQAKKLAKDESSPEASALTSNDPQHTTTPSTNASSGTPSTPSQTPKETFNSVEVLEYLHRNFQKHLANSISSSDTMVYTSLESNSQWTTKPTPNKKTNSKYNPKAVIRQQNKNSLDLLFELNRSVYQQQQQNQQQNQQQQNQHHNNNNNTQQSHQQHSNQRHK